MSDSAIACARRQILVSEAPLGNVTVLATFSWPVTSLLFALIGAVGFLIPVVPGPVVYLTSGFMLVPSMSQRVKTLGDLGGRTQILDTRVGARADKHLCSAYRPACNCVFL